MATARPRALDRLVRSSVVYFTVCTTFSGRGHSGIEHMFRARTQELRTDHLVYKSGLVELLDITPCDVFSFGHRSSFPVYELYRLGDSDSGQHGQKTPSAAPLVFPFKNYIRKTSSVISQRRFV